MTGDRLFWAACAAGGALVVAGCLLPTIEVGQNARIGAGDAQRSFQYDKTIRFASYRQPGARLFLVGGAALIALSAFAFLTSRPLPLLIVAVTALSIAFVVETTRIDDDLDAAWSDGVGVVGCDPEDCAPSVAPAMRDLNDEIRARPEAGEAGFDLDQAGYRARERDGWLLIRWSSIALAAVALYRLFLFGLRPVWAGVAVAACALLLLAYLILSALAGLG